MLRSRREWLVYGVLFAFPIAGNSISSWAGVFFFSLVILALIYRPWNSVLLTGPEKAVLWITCAIFFVMIASAIINGWGSAQTKGLGVQIRFIGFIAIYFLIRHTEDAFKWLVRGSLIGALVLLVQCGIDIFFFDRERAYGHYESPGLVAITAVTFLVVLAHDLFWSDKRALPKELALIGLIFAATAFLLSGSRSTYLTVALLLLCLPFIAGKRRVGLKVMLAGLTVSAFSYLTIHTVQRQVNRAISDTHEYLSATDRLSVINNNSAWQRLEMWRTSLLISKDHPLMGVGWRNFGKNAQTLVDQGLANPVTSQHPHPHSTYFEFLVSDGLIGLSLILALLILPIWVSFRRGAHQPKAALLLKLFMFLYLLNGLTEGGTFIYGNAASFFLVYFAVIYSMLFKGSYADRPFSQ
jgi:O-antigen ligase